MEHSSGHQILVQFSFSHARSFPSYQGEYERHRACDKDAIGGGTRGNPDRYHAIFDRRGGDVSVDPEKMRPRAMYCRVWRVERAY